MSMFTLAMSYWTTSNIPNIPGSYAILFFIATDFTSITSHIHNWVLFSLLLRLFILSGVISPLISSSILGTYSPGEFIFQCHIFAFSYCSWGSHSKNWSGLPFPSPVDHILSKLLTMTCPSWVALHGMAHHFIKLDKAYQICQQKFTKCLLEPQKQHFLGKN